jgi:asparagine synthase (glutamine-hydrolysing)
VCGIAGIQRSGAGAVSGALLARMAGELRHRGPDGTGLYLDADFGMVATRLAIVDVDHGDQPLSDDERRYWVVQNGEIYNHPELRAELRELGHRFATACDTEVLAHAYARWGAGALDRLNGDFAFAVWDTARRELFLARDRFGVRPLYVARFGGDFCFASEARALLRHPLARRELDRDALVELLTTWGNASGRSAFAGIRELPPASWLRVGPDGATEERRWWDISFEPDDRGASDAELVGELCALLEDATRIRLRADVPVSVYVSGGLDSTLLASLARGQATRPQVLFGLGFTDPRFDESAFQDVAAAALGGQIERTTVGPDAIAELLPAAVELAERPFLRTAPAPLLALAGSVRAAGMKVVLTGEGADELFGGYDIFREDKVRRFWARDAASPARPLLFTRLNAYLDADLDRVAPFLREFYGRGLAETADPLYSHRIRFANTGRCLGVLAPEVRAGAADPVEPLLRRLPAGFGRFTPLGRAQYLEIATFLQGTLLHTQADRMLMGRSVEGRFPYLDYRLAELAARLPDRLRLLGLREKHALKLVARGRVPEVVRARTKQPYRAPISQTLLAGGLLDGLDARRLRATGLLDPVAVTALVAKARRRGGVAETDEMALVAALTTTLLQERLVAAPRLAPAALPTKVIRARVDEPVAAGRR